MNDSPVDCQNASETESQRAPPKTSRAKRVVFHYRDQHVLDGPFFDFMSMKKRAAKIAARGCFFIRYGANDRRNKRWSNNLQQLHGWRDQTREFPYRLIHPHRMQTTNRWDWQR